MKKLLILFCLLAIGFGLCGCSVKKTCERRNRKCPPQIITEIRDSIREKIVVKDTIVHDTIPGRIDTAYLDSPCPDGQKMKDRPKKHVFENEWVKVFREIRNNKEMITIEAKPVIRQYRFQKIYIEKLREHFANKSSVVIVKDYHIPWYIYILISVLLLTNLYQFVRRLF